MIARNLFMIGLLAGGTALAGCTTLGGNVEGSFSCVAPDGICAPSSMIDDRALALISGEEGDRAITPAGPYAAPPTEGRGFQTATAAPTRTRERVLRIVFPAQIDGAGRLHEQTAVHAVVEQGDWQQALASNAVATTPKEVAAVTGGDTLLAAVERADPPVTEVAGVDPDLPSDAAIDAARAQATAKQTASVDPIGDIKDQVARRLTAPRRLPVNRSVFNGPANTTHGTKTTPQSARTAPVAAPPKPIASAQPARAPLPVSAQPVRTGPAAAPTTIVPKHATPAGKAAIASVASDPAVRTALARAEPEARSAAREAKPLPVLRASSFPGVQQ